MQKLASYLDVDGEASILHPSTPFSFIDPLLEDLRNAHVCAPVLVSSGVRKLRWLKPTPGCRSIGLRFGLQVVRRLEDAASFPRLHLDDVSLESGEMVRFVLPETSRILGGMGGHVEVWKVVPRLNGLWTPSLPFPKLRMYTLVYPTSRRRQAI